jgi:hypothetical protein
MKKIAKEEMKLFFVEMKTKNSNYGLLSRSAVKLSLKKGVTTAWPKTRKIFWKKMHFYYLLVYRVILLQWHMQYL